MTKSTNTNDWHGYRPFKAASKIIGETLQDGVPYYLCADGIPREKKAYDNVFKVEKIKMKGKYYQGQNPDRTRSYLEDEA